MYPRKIYTGAHSIETNNQPPLFEGNLAQCHSLPHFNNYPKFFTSFHLFNFFHKNHDGVCSNKMNNQCHIC